MKILQYATVNFEKKRALKITSQQYLYLDSVRVLQANPKYKGWAYASNEYYSIMFDMTIRGVQKMSKAMIEKGLLIMGNGSLRQLTDYAYDLITYEQSSSMNKVHPRHEQSSPQTRTKFTPRHEQSSPNSNKDNKENKERDKETLPPFVLDNIEKAKANKKAYDERVSFKSETLSTEEIQANMFQFLKDRNFPEKMKAYSPYRKLTDKSGFVKDFVERNADIETWENEAKLLNHMRSSVKYYKPDPTMVIAKAKSI